MYPTSTKYKQAVQRTDRLWTIMVHVYLDSGETLHLHESDIVLNSVEFKDCSTCSSNMQVGSAYSNGFNFAIANINNAYMAYNFSDAKVVPEVGLWIEEDDAFEYVPLGEFFVNSVGKKRATIPLKCLDALAKANRPLADANLSFPSTLAALFSNVCSTCFISFDTDTFNVLSGWQPMIQEFDVSKSTCRDFIQYAGELLGKNFRINRTGLLEAFWYDSVSTTTTKYTRVKTSEYEDLSIEVTGVSFKNSEGSTTLVGSDTYVMKLSENPLLSTDELRAQVASALLTLMQAIPYKPCTVYHMGDPAWQAGDVVEHVQPDGSSVVAPIMQHTWKFRGSSTLKAVGKTAEQNRQLTAAAKTLQQYEIQARQDLNQGLTAMQQIILSQSSLITSALGFYPYVEYNEDGSVAGVYLMSTPEDSETTVVWAITSGGIGVSHTGIAGPYTSTWTVDDTITANVVNANMIRTGVLQDRNGGNTFYLDLDNGILRMGSYYTKEESDQQINAYFRFVDGKLYIGDEESNIQLVESGDKVAFVDKGTNTEVAYISNERFYAPNLTVLETADFGGYRMFVSNGIAFKWVGRSEISG